jgi:hypothetical protein
MDTSGHGDIYIKDDDSCFFKMLIYLSIMLYIDYVTLIMSLWDSLLLFSPTPQEKFRLVINQLVCSWSEVYTRCLELSFRYVAL